VNLLEKTRRFNSLLQANIDGRSTSYQNLALKFSELMGASVFIVSKDGQILGSSTDQIIDGIDQISNMLPSSLTQKLIEVEQSLSNEPVQSSYTIIPDVLRSNFPRLMTTIIPINGGGTRLGTFILLRFYNGFTEEDLVLGEIAATVIGMKMVRHRTDEIEAEIREKTYAKIALSSLSYSEQFAIEKIMEHMESARDRLLVASDLADKAGITRSVIVNALRKLASAGVLESRSLGMKGTYIRVLNSKFSTELAKLKTSS
jgi:transcriptional pleiotropic repressor